MSKENHFTIRVYGIWINENNEVLVSDEFIGNMNITKFPGGGLEFGEGILDCLKREWIEELGCNVTIKEHFYTTDFFQISVFNQQAQVISVYYLVDSEPLPQNIIIKKQAFDFEKLVDGAQEFRFIPLTNLSEENLSLPIDQLVAKKLKDYSSSILSKASEKLL